MADVHRELIENERTQLGPAQAERNASIAALIILAFDIKDAQYVG